MDTAWTCGSLALTVADIDFLDPALAGGPGDRERGVRLELRLLERDGSGSVYASPGVRASPAVCRIDLLESAPAAADRMHWHPVMHAGEPGDRVFDPAIGADPLRWLHAHLQDVETLLSTAGVAEPEAYAAEAAVLAANSEVILARVSRGLEWARQPWPEVQHDARGLAPFARPA
jgi:hypothetical protein